MICTHKKEEPEAPPFHDSRNGSRSVYGVIRVKAVHCCRSIRLSTVASFALTVPSPLKSKRMAVSSESNG